MKTHWKPEEVEILIATFPHKPTTIIANQLGKKYNAVAQKANRLGLRKTPEYMKTAYECNKTNGQKAWYKKGGTPINKGRKMSPEQYEKCRKTMYKPGARPHNETYNGYERITKDGYIEVRIIKSVFIAKHRWVWEQTHGKLPDNMLITFKDKNPLNVNLDNLIAISKAEHMIRNGIHNYPPEVVQTIRLLSKLNKKISEKQN
jgi:hypothetical protein